MFDAGTMVTRMIMDHLDFMNGMTAIEKGILTMSYRFQSLGSHIGNFLGPLTRFKDQAVAAFSSFETAFAEVKKTVDATPEGFEKLERDIRDMALTIPFAVEEIANVASIAGQLGVPTEAVQKFTKVILDMGVTTDMTTEEAATSMARLATIMKVPTEQFENLGSSINLLGARGAATESEIVNMSLRMGALGTQVGLLPHQILSLAESLSSVGIQAELGGGTMTRMFSIMSDVTKTGGKKLDVLNKIIGGDFKKAFETDAHDAIMQFVAGLNRIDKEGGNTIAMLKEAGLKGTGFSQVIAGLQQSSDKLSKSFETGAQGWGEAGRLAEEAAKRYETFDSQMVLMRNQIRDIAIDVGKVLVPFMQKLNTQILDAVKIWKSLNEQQKLTIIYMGGVATAIAPMLIGMGKVTHFLFGIARTLKTVGFLISTTFSFAGLGAVAPFAPWIIGIGAVAAAVTAFVMYMRSPDGWKGAWESAQATLSEYWTLAKGFIANFGDNMRILGDWFRENWRNIISDVGEVFAALFRSIPELALIALKTWARLQVTWHAWLVGAATRLFQYVFSDEFVSKVVEGISKAWSAFREFMTTLNTAWLMFVVGMGVALRQAAPYLKQLLMGIITMNPADVATALAGIGAALGTQFSEEINRVGGALDAANKQLTKDAKAGFEATNPFEPMMDVLKEGAAEAKGVLDREFGKGEFKTTLPQFKFNMPGAEEVADPLKGSMQGVQDEAKKTEAALEKMLSPLRDVETVAFGSAEHIRGLMRQQVDMTIAGVGGVEAIQEAKEGFQAPVGEGHFGPADVVPVPVELGDELTNEEAVAAHEKLLQTIAENTDPRNQEPGVQLDPVDLN